MIDLNVPSSKLISNLVQSLNDEKKFENLIELVFMKIEDICQNNELKDIFHLGSTTLNKVRISSTNRSTSSQNFSNNFDSLEKTKL